jgi:hypothetical protein
MPGQKPSYPNGYEGFSLLYTTVTFINAILTTEYGIL